MKIKPKISYKNHPLTNYMKKKTLNEEEKQIVSIYSLNICRTLENTCIHTYTQYLYNPDVFVQNSMCFVHFHFNNYFQFSF